MRGPRLLCDVRAYSRLARLRASLLAFKKEAAELYSAARLLLDWVALPEEVSSTLLRPTPLPAMV